MNEKRLGEILARKSEIRTELEKADEKRMAELETEVATLEKEEAQVRSKLALDGKLGNPVDKPDAKNDAEARGKALLEKRSITIATTGVILPEHQSTTIKPTFNEVSTLLDRVNVMNLPGGDTFEQPFITGYGTAGYTTEGGNPTTAEPTFDTATVTKSKIGAYAEVSEELEKLPAADYAGVVVGGITLSVRKKITAEILIGDGTTGHFVGIFDDGATAIDESTDLDFGEIDEDTLDNILYSFGGNEDVEDTSVLVLNKLDVKAFAMLRDANGRKIHTVVSRGNTGTIDGVPYIINSNCKAISAAATTSGQYAMCYGPLMNYTMAVFSPLSIGRSTDYKFKEGLIAHRGVIFAGGNVTVKNGFLRIKKS